MSVLDYSLGDTKIFSGIIHVFQLLKCTEVEVGDRLLLEEENKIARVIDVSNGMYLGHRMFTFSSGTSEKPWANVHRNDRVYLFRPQGA